MARHDSFAEALGASLTFAGPANYGPVLVGAIAGARWGAARIPTHMLKPCSLLPRVREAADALSGTWQGLQPRQEPMGNW